jgi:hypothetical protein
MLLNGGDDMYVLQLEPTERNYLLALLKRRRERTAAALANRLRSSEDVFGVVMWSDSDIASQLNEEGVEDTADRIRVVRESYLARHIDERMVELGWDVLEQAVSELNWRQAIG